MSVQGTLESQISTDNSGDNANMQKVLALACRTIQRNPQTQFLGVDDVTIYAELKRQVKTPTVTSSVPAGHIVRNGT